MSQKPLPEELREALQAAADHLEYCGYGDKWERQCAVESKLPEKIDAALKRAADETSPAQFPPDEVMLEDARDILIKSNVRVAGNEEFILRLMKAYARPVVEPSPALTPAGDRKTATGK